MSLPALARATLLVGAGALVGGGVWYAADADPQQTPVAVPAPVAAKSAPFAAAPAQTAEAMQEARRKLDEALRKGAANPPAEQATEGGVSSIARSLPAAAARDEEDAMIRRAARAMADGDVASARLLLTRAARGGDGRALFLLGESYDPEALAARGVSASLGDAEKARAHYRQAMASGYAPARPKVAAAR